MPREFIILGILDRAETETGGARELVRGRARTEEALRTRLFRQQRERVSNWAGEGE